MDSQLDAASLPDTLSDAMRVRLDAGHVVFRAGQACETFYFLIAGQIRVDLVARSGKPLTLYRFGAGETCILTTSCLIGDQHYSAEAVTETEVEAAVVPASSFHAMMEASPGFRQLVFANFSSRLSDLMTKIEALTSRPIEERLAVRLLDLHETDAPIRVTHEALAVDLGTAREVVSRKLAKWERQGLISRRRGEVSLSDVGLLKQMIEDR